MNEPEPERKASVAEDIVRGLSEFAEALERGDPAAGSGAEECSQPSPAEWVRHLAE